MSDRARQFMPFDALKGFREEIQKKQKIVIDKKELSEDSCVELNYKLTQVKKGMMLNVIYYKDNEYIYVSGLVSNFDVNNRILTIVKTKIPFDDIYDISSDEIKSY